MKRKKEIMKYHTLLHSLEVAIDVCYKNIVTPF